MKKIQPITVAAPSSARKMIISSPMASEVAIASPMIAPPRAGLGSVKPTIASASMASCQPW